MKCKFINFSLSLQTESRRYFTTLDILLANEIEIDDQGTRIKNQLRNELGSGVVNALWDLFIHHASPRPRFPNI
jgi:hypothetical protein